MILQTKHLIKKPQQNKTENISLVIAAFSMYEYNNNKDLSPNS